MLSFLDDFDAKILSAYVFSGLLIVSVLVCIILLIRSVRSSRNYENEALPSITGFEVEEIVEEPIHNEEESSFAFYDDEVTGEDSEASKILREANNASRSSLRQREREGKKGKFFGRK